MEDLAVGDPVFGGLRFFAQADHLLIDAAHVCAVPPGLGLDTAAGLQITSLTALAGVRAIAPRAGETVLVTGAAGGVGVLAAQLARAAGATVLGTAGPDNHPFLQSLGIVPVLYGEGLADRLRDLAPGGIQAAYSTRGLDEVRALVGLGIPAGRINAIAAGPAAGELGAHTDGMAASLPGDLERIAAAVASGALISPIDSVYDLEDVGSAYARLQAGHVRGKILLRTASAAGAAELLGA